MCTILHPDIFIETKLDSPSCQEQSSSGPGPVHYSGHPDEANARFLTETFERLNLESPDRIADIVKSCVLVEVSGPMSLRYHSLACALPVVPACFSSFLPLLLSFPLLLFSCFFLAFCSLFPLLFSPLFSLPPFRSTPFSPVLLFSLYIL